MPSVVEFETGRVVSSVNIPLADVPLREVLGERLGVPVFVDNDATVAALAEAHDDQLQLVARDLVMITVGTGVGGGFVLGGRIYRGATGGAGELGHTIDRPRPAGAVPEPDGFPQPGSLEYAAAGHALDRLAARGAPSASRLGARAPAAAGRAGARAGCGAGAPGTAMRRPCGSCEHLGRHGSGSASRTRSTRSIPRRS